MPITRAQIRAHVLAYFDQDAVDMPDSIIDRWISEGWSKIARRSETWPSMETSSPLSITAGTFDYSVPYRQITFLYGPDGPMRRMSLQEADTVFAPPIPTGRPAAWAQWQKRIWIFPLPDAAYTFTVVGYRAIVPALDVADNVPIDLPTADAEDILVAWVMYRACLHQLELEQAQPYAQDFEASLKRLATSENSSVQTIVLNSNPARDTSYPFGPLSFASGGASPAPAAPVGGGGYGGY